MPTLNDAVSAIKAGRRAEGRSMLSQVLLIDPNNVSAMLWMTEVADTADEKRKYLNRILVIDPNNAFARKGLTKLPMSQERDLSNLPSPTVPSSKLSNETPPLVLQGAGIIEETKQCPFCAEKIRADAIVCRFCGRDLPNQSKPEESSHDRILKMLLLGLLLILAAGFVLQRASEQQEVNVRVQMALYGYVKDSFTIATLLHYFGIALGLIGVIVLAATVVSSFNKRS